MTYAESQLDDLGFGPDNGEPRIVRKTYRIENWCPTLNRWVTYGQFNYMPKGFADGAWSMLTAFIGGDRKFRLVTNDGTIVREYCTGHIKCA